MENHLTPYQSVITEIKSIISSGQEAAYSASSKAMLLTYWNIGKRIVEQELGGSERAEYGRGLISALAEDLTKEFGKNYSKRNLHYYIKFYQCFPDEQIVNACVHNLNWTHIRSLLRVADENARYWYGRSVNSFVVFVFFKAVALGHKLLILCLKAVRDVFQENQPENNRLVFRSVNVAAKDTGGIPNLFFKSNIACICLSHSSYLRSLFQR